MDIAEISSRLKVATKSYLAGETILYQGEVPRNAYILKSGLVKIYSITRGGEERIVDFCAPGDLMAEAWLFGHATSTIYYYQAIDTSEVYEISKQNLLAYIHEADVTNRMLDKFSRIYTASYIRLTALEQGRARDKLLFTFYYLLKRFGKEVVPGWYMIQLRLTHQTIADLVGLTRETTALELNSIKKTKILSYERQKYLVNHNRLLQAIGEDSFSGIKL